MLVVLVAIATTAALIVSAAWASRLVVAPDRGEVSPEAAVTVWLLRLNASEEIGLLPVLARQRRDDLLGQWRDYRREMDRRPPSKLESVDLAVTQLGGGRAVVVEQVRGIWWGDGAMLAGASHPWRFEVREDDGWRIWSVDLPPWCGVHVRADACG